MSTPEALPRAGKLLGVAAGLIDYAGLKDKHAVSLQHLSVPMSTGPGRPGLTAVPAGVLEAPGVRLEALGIAALPVTADAIIGNRFSVIVRDLSREGNAELARRADLLRDLAGDQAGAPSSDTTASPPNASTTDGARDSLLIVNYFGAQRFGSARHGAGFVAAALVRGDFESAVRLAIGTPARKDSGRTRSLTRALAEHWGDWSAAMQKIPPCPERRAVEVLIARGAKPGSQAAFREAFAALPAFSQQIAVEAFQSHLWNRTAAGLVTSHAGDRPGDVLVGRDDFGDMAFLPARRVPRAWLSLDVPLLGPTTHLAEPWAPFAHAALAEHGLTPEQLQIPGLRRPFFGEAPRLLCVRASAWSLDKAETDDLTPGRLKRRMAFDLPRGSYATVVLRALGQ